MIDELEQIKRLDEYKTELKKSIFAKTVYRAGLSLSVADVVEKYIETVERTDELKNRLIQKLLLKKLEHLRAVADE